MAKIQFQVDLSKEDVNTLVESNSTSVLYPKNKTIYNLFEEQVERTPDQIAIVFGENQLTYRELNYKSNSLSKVLTDKGVKRNSIIGIMIDRSIEMIVGILAILKSGGAYLPIDPEYPIDRKEYMLKDSQISLLLCGENQIDKNLNYHGEAINLYNKQIYKEYSNSPDNINEPKDLAYVIYTSGTTGKPKGVMIEHKAVSNTIHWRKDEYQLKCNDNVLQLFSFSFDGFIASLFTPLVSGATVFLLNNYEAKDPIAIKNCIATHKITHMIIVPTLYTSLLEVLPEVDAQSLRMITLAGEKIGLNHITKSMEINPNIEIINEYGPTENSIATTICRNVSIENMISIGRPIANNRLYIVNENNELLPIGKSGELCISGEGLAKGYLNLPDLTSKKFVDNPFEPGEKMYKTGDLVKWLPDGSIAFLGRMDNQVKIRGFRIELDEIESYLLAYEVIDEAVVTVREDHDGSKYLCAYIVSKSSISLDQLREYLSKRIPEYMIPSFFTQVDIMPITINGKVDKNALPDPKVNRMAIKYVAPTNETEKMLIEIWNNILNVDNIGIKDHFFHLGGQSLKAANLITKINKSFNIEFPLHEVFNHPTVEEQAHYIKYAKEVQYENIEKIPEKAYYPTSPAQKRLYVINQLEGIGIGYNNPISVTLDEHITIDCIKRILNEIISRHEVFRTSFEIINGEIVQTIHSNFEFEVEYIEVEEIRKEVINDFIKPFDLSKAPLFRARVISSYGSGCKSKILVMDTHHIITDGVSMNIFLDEFSKLYHGEKLNKLNVQYKDYTIWQSKLLRSDSMKEQEKYWLKTFAGKCPALNFPTDYKRPKQLSFEGKRQYFNIDYHLSKSLINMSDESNTLYMLLLAAYYTLLFKYTGQEDIVVGSPASGRIHHDTNDIIGMFVNTLPMRNFPEGEKPFIEFLREVKTNTLNALENQSYQLDTLIERLENKRDISRNPLFDTVFSFYNMSKFHLVMDGKDYAIHDLETKSSKFDITFYVAEIEDEIKCFIEYNTNLFKEESISRLINHYINILKEIIENPAKKLSDIQMLSKQEKEQIIINQFDQAKANYPKEKTIHQIIEEQVKKTPENIAVLFEKSQLTYKELNEKANSLARTLRNKGISPDDFVAIMMDRSIEMIIGIVAILKSGGAYLPIDPSYPEDRINYTLKDSGAKLLLTQGHLSNRIEFNGDIIDINDSNSYHCEVSNLDNVNRPTDLAYMIYTSGSTGKPKGVLIEHRNVVRLLINDKFQYDFSENDIWPMFHSFCFDVSVWEMYGALFNGGKLVVVPKLVAQNTPAFRELLRKEKITILNQTPSAFYALLKEELANKSNLLKIRYVIFAGEALQPKKLKEWKDKYPNTRCINMYGITETTVHTTFKEITAFEIESNVSNIGKPLPTLTCYLFNQNKSLVPVGVVGEIYVGGDGVARGYFNNEELTSERFIQNPYNPEERLYKSGDLARLLPNGEMEYLGRIDHQVKIRGFRIELGEIENQLLKHSSIKDVAVIPREDGLGEKYLCAYFTADREITITELREHVSMALPSYMVPAIFLQLEKWPITSNGKLDRKALPEPNENIKVGTTYVPPKNPLEEKLAKIWGEVLGIDRVGVQDNFFEIGGHSLKATSLVYKINSELQTNVSFLDIYTNSTVTQLAEYITSKDYNNIYKDEDLVLLKKGTSKNNIFFVHGGNGMVDTYAEICRHGIADFNCWGIEAEIDKKIGRKILHLEEYAKRYVQIIKKAQPKGPYYIFGTCIGGTIAFEITRQLEQICDEDIFLGLASATPPDPSLVYEFTEQTLLEEEKKHILSILSLLTNNQVQLNDLGIEEMWKLAIKHLENGGINLTKVVNFVGEDVPENKKNTMLEYFKAVNSVRSLCSLRDRYIPSTKIKTRVNYYGASEYDIDTKYFWQNYCLEPVNYFVTPGDHFTIFKEPNVKSFAELVSKHILLVEKQFNRVVNLV
jgi:tyrocidine synthetase III